MRFTGEPRYFQLSARCAAASRPRPTASRAWVTPGVTPRPLGRRGRVQRRRRARRTLPLRLAAGAGRPAEPAPGRSPGLHRRAAAGALHLRRPAADVLRRRRHTRASRCARSRTSPPPTASTTSVTGFTPFFGTQRRRAARGRDRRRSCCPATRGDRGRGARGIRRDRAGSRAGGRRTTAPATGILRADSVLEYTGGTPQPLVRAQQPRWAPITGDGDAFLEPGESATLARPGDQRGRRHGDRRQRHRPPRRPARGGDAAQSSLRRPRRRERPRRADFTLALAATYPLGKRVPLTVRVTFAGVLSPTIATFSRADRASRRRRRASSPTPGPAVPIPDDSTVGATVTIPVTGRRLRVEADVLGRRRDLQQDAGSTTVGIDHSFVGDLTGMLTSPAGTQVALFQRSGGSGQQPLPGGVRRRGGAPISIARGRRRRRTPARGGRPSRSRRCWTRRPTATGRSR